MMTNKKLPTTGGLAQAGQYFAGKIGTIFVRNFFVGMELKPPPLRQAAGTLEAIRRSAVRLRKEKMNI